jgi:uncharacterized protein YkwD
MPTPPLIWSLRAADRGDFLLALHDDARRAAGAGPLAVDERLSAAALVQARDNARRRLDTHLGSDGSTAGVRVTRAGYRWSEVGENAAAGQRDALEAVRAWLRSPGHRRNLLDPAFVHLGAAFADAGDGTRYWVVTFGRPA